MGTGRPSGTWTPRSITVDANGSLGGCQLSSATFHPKKTIWPTEDGDVGLGLDGRLAGRFGGDAAGVAALVGRLGVEQRQRPVPQIVERVRHAGLLDGHVVLEPARLDVVQRPASPAGPVTNQRKNSVKTQSGSKKVQRQQLQLSNRRDSAKNKLRNSVTLSQPWYNQVKG